MNPRREFRKLRFDRKLDVKRLRAALTRTMREAMKNPLSGSALARVESILIEPNRTTIFLSGNRRGLEAVAKALRSTFSDVNISKASRNDAVRPPRT